MLHVLERCLEAKSLDKVVVATDHVRVARVVESVGGTVCMTKASHRSGSDRVWEVASKGDWSMVVNIQGDQPGVNPMTIDACVSALGEEGVDMATAAAPLLNPNIIIAILNVKILVILINVLIHQSLIKIVPIYEQIYLS